MAANRFHSLCDVNPGSYNWNVKVRIVRSWRGVSFSGEEFKGLNLLLIDDKNNRIHAFVPGNIIANHEQILVEGNICKISNFSVKLYKPEEKFRCINSEQQMILTTYSKVEKVEHDDMVIANNIFDFYDLCDLSDIANENVYLTDVIGVIQKDLPLAKVMNRFNNVQSQLKFTIVDGRASVNVTFWDSIADDLVKGISEATEFPIIIIIASAKISSWQGSKQTEAQVEISNVSATKFYLNYQDPTVWHLRKLLNTPLFSKYDFSTQLPERIELLSVAEIKNLTMDSVEKEVVCEVKVVHVIETSSWYMYLCSSCYKEIEMRNGKFKCYRCCDRDVPHPLRKWRIYIQATDHSGTIDILLFDREARTILDIEDCDSDDEENNEIILRQIPQKIENNHYMIKLEIRNGNIDKTQTTYYASGIYHTFSDENVSNIENSTPTDSLIPSLNQASGSSYHLDGFSQLNFETQDSSKKKKRTIRKTNK